MRSHKNIKIFCNQPLYSHRGYLWSTRVYFFLPALFLLFAQEKILSVSTLVTFVGLFALGFTTVREKSWNYIGWGCLTIALGYLMFSIPHGIQLVYIAILTGLVCVVSYFGFAYKNVTASGISVVITGIVFLAVFVSHAVILANPKVFGIDVQGNEIGAFATEAIQKAANMDPVDFVKTDEGRKVAIQVYDTSLFISDTDLEKIVENNPEPIKKVQQELLSTTPNFTNNPYSYIISVYTHPLLKLLSEN